MQPSPYNDRAGQGAVEVTSPTPQRTAPPEVQRFVGHAV